MLSTNDAQEPSPTKTRHLINQSITGESPLSISNYHEIIDNILPTKAPTLNEGQFKQKKHLRTL